MPDEQTTIVALLHGALESGVFDLEFIIRQGFSHDMVRALAILLLHKELPYQEYLEQVKTCPVAWVVKHEEIHLSIQMFFWKHRTASTSFEKSIMAVMQRSRLSSK